MTDTIKRARALLARQPPLACSTFQCNHNEDDEMTNVHSTSDERIGNNVMRHEYRLLSDDEKAKMQAIKDLGLHLHDLIESCGQSRELSLAKTKTEEAVMWAVKHITK